MITVFYAYNKQYLLSVTYTGFSVNFCIRDKHFVQLQQADYHKLWQSKVKRVGDFMCLRIHGWLLPRGPTPLEISYTCVEIQDWNPRNLEIQTEIL